MAKKADAWKEYKEAAMVDMMLQTLPKAIILIRNIMLQNLPKPIQSTILYDSTLNDKEV